MFVVLSGHVADVLMMILAGDGISRTETLHCISNYHLNYIFDSMEMPKPRATRTA